jgi:hypothetical protein
MSTPAAAVSPVVIDRIDHLVLTVASTNMPGINQHAWRLTCTPIARGRARL